MVISGFQNTKILLLKDMLLTGVKKFFVIKQIKNTVTWTYVISDLNEEEIVGNFYKKRIAKD